MGDSSHFLDTEQILEVFNLTKTATAIHVGETAVIQMANDTMLAIWGKDRSVIGKSLEEALPELKGQPFIDMFARVWREGLTISGTDTPADLIVNGIKQTYYFEFEYRAIKDASGKTICILHTAVDVTERVLNREVLESAQQNLELLQREQSLNEELAASNEELAASNEELAAVNEELHQAQEGLSEMNNRLEEKVESRLQALSESEARFRTMAEGTDMFIAVGDETGNAIYFNEAWMKLTGRSIKELMNFGWADLVHPEDRERWIKNYLKTFEQRAAFSMELRVLSKEGVYRWLLATAPPRFRKDGSFAGYISSCIDITDRKNGELELQRLAAIVEASLEFVGMADLDGRIAYLNAAALRKLGWKDVKNKSIMDCVYPDDRDLAVQLLPTMIEKGSFQREIRFYNEKTGEPFWLQWNAFTIKDPSSGKIIGVASVSPDISERKKYGQELQAINNEIAASNEQLKLAIATASLGTWRADLVTGKLIISDRSKKIHGLGEDEELTFDESLQMVLPEYRELIKQTIERASRDKGIFAEEYQLQPRDGAATKWLRTTGRLFYDNDKKLAHISGTIMDITESKDNELRKNDFIAMVSHELKTPLTSLTALIQIANARLKEKEEGFLNEVMEKANGQAKKMSSMINGFLNISRLESGKIIISKQDFNMGDLVQEMIDEMKLTVASHIITMSTCDHVIVDADRDKIGSVVSNLLSNAVKYSPKETLVEVHCATKEGNVIVSVVDHGLGIEKEDMDKLFDRYYRVESKKTRHISGFGIGLYLSAEIINRHHGKIWAESELGKGSTFYFSLPLSQ